jgi:hypothetical protein
VSERGRILKAVTPLLVVAAVVYVPPLKHATVSGLDAVGRAFGRSVTNEVNKVTTTTTTTP